MYIDTCIHGVKWKLGEDGTIIGAVKGGSKLDVLQIMQDHDLHQAYHEYMKGVADAE